MPVIKISAFSGERPLMNPRLLPETAAMVASNVRLDDGALTPLRKPSPTGSSVSDPAHTTIFLHGDDWLSWPGVVHAALGPVAQDRLYYTGDGAPKMRVAGDVYPLALPAPTVPSVAVTGTGSGDIQSKAYAWTYVTSFGEESAPSPTSAVVDWQPGQTVTLSGFPSVPTGRAISHQRIYRSQTGASGTYLYLIAERSASSADFIDTVPVDQFSEPLPSAGWTPPPDDLAGLISMPNGMMAGFVGREIYFCEPWRPHAWPQKYSLTCDSPVVGLCAIGSVLVVMTNGNPYLMTGSHPDSMQSVKLEANLPCINGRGIVDMGFAACYPSNEGLVAVAADGSVTIPTRQLFNRDGWLALSPSTIIGAQVFGTYALFYDTLDADGNPYSGSIMINVGSGEYLVRTPESAKAVFYDTASSALYFTPPDDINIFRFDAPDTNPASYYWRSKEFWLTSPQSFGAILVDLTSGQVPNPEAIDSERAEIEAENEALILAGTLQSEVNATPINGLVFAGDTLLPYPEYDQITITVYADRKLVWSGARAGKIERLPAKNKARLWEVAISGTVPVANITMAGTIDELRSTP